jgi:hypothetical protein
MYRTFRTPLNLSPAPLPSGEGNRMFQLFFILFQCGNAPYLFNSSFPLSPRERGRGEVNRSNTSPAVNPSQAITLSRQCSPLMMESDEREVRSVFASSFTHCSLALFSTGGAVTATCTVVPSGATVIPSRFALGLILTANVQRSNRYTSIDRTSGCGGTSSMVGSSSASSMIGAVPSSPCRPCSSPLITPSRLSWVVSIALKRARKLSR